ncbi:peptidylprolyl isomerase [Pseudomonas syringae]|nr:peptidylprolyl isomerase [Pseudomonas syringae]MCQ3031124.1 peptidylprolyl isomerase [Pseudomonas syringae]MDG6398585.1 peptidylprolyl isomerase [Pseudomonas quasicaspiana]
MKKRTVVAGFGVLVALAVGVSLALRPGSDPVAATQPTTPVVASETSSTALARLGNQSVAPEELMMLLDAMPAESREQLRSNRPALESWIRARLAEKAVIEQADNQGWRQRPEVERQTRAASEQIVLRDYLQSVSQVPAGYPSDEEVRQAYDAGKSNWMTPPLFRVSQVFFAVGNAQDLETVRKRAVEMSRKAQAAPAEFAALSIQYSQDPAAAKRDSDSGLQPLQQLLPEVRGAVSRLKTGAVSEPLQSAAGFHVVKLVEQQPARLATLAELHDRLVQALRTQRQEQIAKAYLEGMLNTATLSIDGAMLNKLMEEKL